MSSTFAIERTQHIHAPLAAVHDRIADLRRWQTWSPWEDLDPDLERTYGGASAGVGAWYAWDGNRKAGKGRMEIVDVDPASVRLDVRFLKPFRSESTTLFSLRPDGDGTRVVWTMTGPLTGLSKVMGWFLSMDKLLGPDLEKGLGRLRVVSEAADA